MKAAKRTACAILAAVIFAVSLTSCAGWDNLMSSLGFDTRDYSAQSVIAVHDADSEVAAELEKSILLLTMDSPSLPTFTSSSQAIKLCRDSVLNRMLTVNFARYTGNIELLDRAAEEYPQIRITNLIPAKDFEQQYYTAFGGSTKISNESAEYFMYLPKLDAYTALSSPIAPEIKVDFISIEETDNTYRMTVTVTVEGRASPHYRIVMIKREDETVYFRSVQPE